MCEPVGQGADEIAGGRGKGGFGALGDGVDSELVGDRKLVELGDDGRNALGQFGGEEVEIVEDGRETEEEEDAHDEGHSDDQKEDGGRAGGVAVVEFDGGDAIDDGHQDCCEEGADIDDQQFFLQGPGQGKEEEDADGEKNVAAYVSAGLVGVGDDGGRWGCQRVLLGEVGCRKCA